MSSSAVKANERAIVFQKPKTLALGQALITPDLEHPNHATITLQFNLKPNQNFGTQSVDGNMLTRIRGVITGVGVDGIFLADADESGFVTHTGNGSINLTFNQVPYGRARRMEFDIYDANTPAIEKVAIGTAFDLSSASKTLEVSFRTLPLVTFANNYTNAMENGTPTEKDTWENLDLNTMQAFMDQITGVSGNAPTYIYSNTHPLLINIGNLLNDFIVNNGNLNALSPSNPAYLNLANTLSGNISGLVSNDQISLRMTDGVSPILSNLGNQAFNLSPIQASQGWYVPTEWDILVTPNAGTNYSVQFTNASDFPENNKLHLSGYNNAVVRHIVLTPTLPELNTLSASSGQVGDTIRLSGNHFHSNADGNQVMFGATAVPTNDITVISATELDVKVPAGISGSVAVTAAVGTQVSQAQAFSVTAPSLNMTFISIPAGSFIIGSPVSEGGHSGEQPQHQVNLSAFQIQNTEVTQKQWFDVMGKWPNNTPPNSSYGVGDDYPIYGVSWCEIAGVEGDPVNCAGYTDSFMKRLNTNYPGTYRLPTEAEWEYAARAGSTTAFPCGNYLPFAGNETACPYTMGWYWENNTYGGASSGSKPVAQKLANAWGLYDMHGNILEWVHDQQTTGYYTATPSNPHPRNNPTGPESGEQYRVVRGGGWEQDAFEARSAERMGAQANSSDIRYGFRVLKE